MRVTLIEVCWIALTAESYIKLTCQYISDDWQMNAAVLLTKSLPSWHTADHLAEKMNEAVGPWGLEDQVIACVHDNTANIVAANSPAECPGLPLLALPTPSDWS